MDLIKSWRGLTMRYLASIKLAEELGLLEWCISRKCYDVISLCCVIKQYSRLHAWELQNPKNPFEYSRMHICEFSHNIWLFIAIALLLLNVPSSLWLNCHEFENYHGRKGWIYSLWERRPDLQVCGRLGGYCTTKMSPAKIPIVPVTRQNPLHILRVCSSQFGGILKEVLFF